MKLSDETKEVGVENFFSAVANKETSGKLLQTSLQDGLASKKGLGAKVFKYAAVDRPVRVGVIGTGDEGGVLIGALNPKYVEVVAIADLRPYNIYRAFHGDKSSPNARRVRSGLMNIFGWPDEATAREHVAVYEDDYEDLLDDENVEAVIIALPLHLHAEASIKAMRKGKHVLCEKLMAHSVAQCKEMARVSKKEDRLLTIGHQRHYSVLYEYAVTLVKKNIIGDIHHIRAQWHRANLPGKDSWQKTLPTDPKMKAELEQAQKDLAGATKRLAEEKEKAKGRITDPKTIGLLAKWDRELVALPKKIARLKEKLATLAAQPAPDLAQQKKLQDEAGKHTKRIAAIQGAYPKKLRLNPNLARKLNLAALSDRVEILTYQLRDAEIATKVKDYGYQDRQVGDRKVPALEELIRWRLWNRTGGGLMAELGSHQLDAAGIFISALRNDGVKVHPLSVTAVGGRHIFPHDRDIDDHVYCSFEYPAPGYNPKTAPEKKIVVSYSSINGNGFGGYGETVLGTKGTLIINREKEAVLLGRPKNGEYTPLRVTGKGAKLSTTSRKPGDATTALGQIALKAPISRGYTEEIEHWCSAIRAKENGDDSKIAPLRCGPKIALADAVIALTTNLAIRRGKEGKDCHIDFKESWFDVDSDETPEGDKPNVDRPEY